MEPVFYFWDAVMCKMTLWLSGCDCHYSIPVSKSETFGCQDIKDFKNMFDIFPMKAIILFINSAKYSGSHFLFVLGASWEALVHERWLNENNFYLSNSKEN